MKRIEDYKVDLPEGKSGDWSVVKFEAKEDGVQEIRYAMHGRSYVPGHYTQLCHTGGEGPVMSDTPDEVRDHLEAIYQATGRVLINGLGLGVVLKAVLDKPGVTHVDVVENSEDVMSLVAPHYTDSRITFHLADAFGIKWPVGTWWDVAWHDIWPTICTDNMDEMTRLKRKYGNRTGWQGCWVEDHLRRVRKADEAHSNFWGSL